MKQQIIAIVGMPGAGKSEAAAFFKQKKLSILRFGDQTDIGLKESGMPLTEENERMYRENLRKELGMAAYAIKTYERYQKLENPGTVIFDGLYSWEEYTYLIDKIPVLLLHIYARPVIRYARLEKRPIRPLTPQQARSRDFAEIEHLNKGGPIALADYVVINETSLDYLHTQLETFLQEIT
ncbi:AAA family ATPase [Candidatus Roizmanbacteria bacterium]|nr:AAA family ATPase [Candidatus Roizmanbacteria bacterium]